MTINVLDHKPEPPLAFNVGGLQLVVQTGTLICDFNATDDGDWRRDRLTHHVLELPLNPFSVVRATASATPASMVYAPPAGFGSATGLIATGTIGLSGVGQGWSEGGAVQVSVQVGGPVSLPVIGGSVGLTIAGAGWAVDRTQAVHTGKHVDLVADLAVRGPVNLFRLAYSMFVTISPRNNTVFEPGTKQLEP